MSPPLTTSTPPRRRIRYRGTYVAMVAMFIVLLLANYIGRIEPITKYQEGFHGPDLGVYDECLHGWPWTYLERDRVMVFGTLPGGPWLDWRLSELHPWEGVAQFSLKAMAGNTFIAFLLVPVAGMLYQAWRRRRARLLQFTLGDMFLLVTGLSALAGYYTIHNTAHTRQRAALHTALLQDLPDNVVNRKEQAQEHLEGYHNISWRRGGPGCLRNLVGETPFAPFDRVVGLYVSLQELEGLTALKSLQLLYASGFCEEREGQLLTRFPQLRGISMHADVWNPNAPHLPALQFLELPSCICHGRGLTSLPKLEVLDLTNGELHGDVFGALRGSPRLRKLLLAGTNIGDEELARLPQLTHLRELRLGGTKITDRSLPILKRLSSLQELWLDDIDHQQCPLSNEAIAELRQALPHCEIID